MRGTCWSWQLVGDVVLHAAPKDVSQDYQCRIGYGSFLSPLAIGKQLSVCCVGKGCGVGELTLVLVHTISS